MVISISKNKINLKKFTYLKTNRKQKNYLKEKQIVIIIKIMLLIIMIIIIETSCSFQAHLASSI